MHRTGRSSITIGESVFPLTVPERLLADEISSPGTPKFQDKQPETSPIKKWLGDENQPTANRRHPTPSQPVP